MASIISDPSTIDYPDSDGKPMAETPWHRMNMTDVIEVAQTWLADDPLTYVSGNMFLYYVEGNKHKHVSPDVFVVRGIPTLPERRAYFTWIEGKGPDLVIEMTSPSTKNEDLKGKFALYRDVLKVREYFLFDPLDEYLDPALQGYRLRGRRYAAIKPIEGRMPSEVLGLHFERDAWRLRLHDPVTGQRLLTGVERAAEAEPARRRAEQGEQREHQAREKAEAEVERLRRELAALKKAGQNGSGR